MWRAECFHQGHSNLHHKIEEKFRETNLRFKYIQLGCKPYRCGPNHGNSGDVANHDWSMTVEAIKDSGVIRSTKIGCCRCVSGAPFFPFRLSNETCYFHNTYRVRVTIPR